MVDADDDSTNCQPGDARQSGIDQPRQRAFVQAKPFGRVQAKAVDDDLPTYPQHRRGADGGQKRHQL